MTTKPLSELLTWCLNLITKHYKEYNDGITRNSGASCFWIIDNSLQVLRKLDKLNGTVNATHSDSFDFSTLYTNIPHHLFKECLVELAVEAYRVRGATYISVNAKNTSWSDIAYRGHVNIHLDSWYIDFLVDNIYI